MVAPAASKVSYLSRLSGPLLDRIELQIEVPLLPRGLLSAQQPSESSAEVAERVAAARQRQLARQGKKQRPTATG